MANDDVLTRNDKQELAVRVVNATETSAVVNPDDVFTRTDEGNLAVRVVGAGGGEGGTSNYNELSNKPQINGVTLSGNKTASDLGISGVTQILVAGRATVQGFSVPNPTAEEMVAIYNAVVAGNSVQVVDNTNVYYQVMLADSMDGAINVEIMFFSELAILYSLEHDVVTIGAKKIGGAVDSVNGKTGAVVLSGEDISADVDELPNTIQGHLQSMSDKIKDIEMVKVPNATIVGSPAINHGQISGFSSGDYLQFPFELDVQNRFLKVNFCFTTGEDVTTQQNVLDSYYGLALAIANGKGLMAVSHNGTSWAFQTVGSMDILPNTTYFARLTWNGMLYKTELSTNHVDYVSDMTAGSTQAPYKRTMFIGGSPDLFGVGSAHPFKGSINLNYANVELDDNDIWEGMDDVGLGTRLDINVSNISEEGKAKIRQIVGIDNLNEVLDLLNGENI